MNKFIQKIKKKATASNIIYAVVMAFLLVVLINPDAKSLVLKGMMEVGVFSPSIPDQPQVGDRKEVKLAPEAAFENGAGEQVKISSLKGKVIFINFWATWCPPCRVEMPTIDKLYAKFKDNKDIVFLVVDADNKYAKSNQYLADHDLDLPLFVPSGNIPYDYFSGALPTTVMINKKGEIVFRHAGAADYSDPKMVDFVEKLIAGEL